MICFLYRMVDSGAKACIDKLAAILFAAITTLGTTGASIGGYYATLTNYRRVTGTFAVPYTTMVASIITIMVTILAQVAIKKPGKGLVGTTILLTGLLAAGIGLTTSAHVMRGETLHDVVTANMMHELTRTAGTPNQLEAIQKDLGCCGTFNYTVYTTLDGHRHGSVPKSCCRDPNSSEACNEPPLEGKIHETGCIQPLTEIMTAATQHCVIALGLLGAAVSAVWISFLIWFSLCM